MFSEQLHCVGVNFRLWICDHYRLPAPDTLEQRRSYYASGLHGAAGAEYCDVLIEPGILRQTNHTATVALSQYDSPGLLRAGHFQNCAQFRLAHPASGAISAALAAGKVAVIKIAASKPVIEPDQNINAAAYEGYQPRVLQSGYGKSPTPAGKRPKPDVSNLGLPLHTSFSQPNLILSEHLAHQSAQIEQRGQTQYDSDDDTNGAGTIIVQGGTSLCGSLSSGSVRPRASSNASIVTSRRPARPPR